MAYLLEHPHASLQEVVEKTQVSIRTVTNARAQLIHTGEVAPSYFAKKGNEQRKVLAHVDAKAKAAGIVADQVEKALERLNEHLTSPLTSEESIEILSEIVRNARRDGNFPLLKDAVIALNRLQERTAVVSLGPPDPLTISDKVERTTQILDVVGPLITAAAAIAAFTDPADRVAFEEEIARLSATRPLPPDQGPQDTPGDSSLQATPEEEERTPDAAPRLGRVD